MGLAGRAKTLAKRLLGRGGDADPSAKGERQPQQPSLRGSGLPLPACALIVAPLSPCSPNIYTLRLQMAER